MTFEYSKNLFNKIRNKEDLTYVELQYIERALTLKEIDKIISNMQVGIDSNEFNLELIGLSPKHNYFLNIEKYKFIKQSKPTDIIETERGTVRVCYDSGDMAYTLDPEDIGTDSNGWKVKGKIYEDYYEWVNEFEATKGKSSFVKGDFENFIECSSLEDLDEFLSLHMPETWDYRDI